MPQVRVELPMHLRTLGRIAGHEVALDVPAPATVRAVLDALEAAYPMLRGTVRDQVTQQRRAFLRFFACQQDISLEPSDNVLPDAVVDGREPLIILGAVAGGSAEAEDRADEDRSIVIERGGRCAPRWLHEQQQQIFAVTNLNVRRSGRSTSAHLVLTLTYDAPAGTEQ